MIGLKLPDGSAPDAGIASDYTYSTPAPSASPASTSPASTSPLKLPNMNLPPLNLNIASSAKTGDLMSSFGSDHSGFSVNFGNGVSQGGGSSGEGLPSYYWAIGAVLGFVLWKKYS